LNKPFGNKPSLLHFKFQAASIPQQKQKSFDKTTQYCHNSPLSTFRPLAELFINPILTELSMYAVIKTGGKQYKVTVGEKLKVEQIPAELDSQIELEVLMIADGDKLKLGEEAAKAKVVAKVVAHGRGEKVRIFKMRRRKHYQKRQGHRQNFTQIEILSIA